MGACCCADEGIDGISQGAAALLRDFPHRGKGELRPHHNHDRWLVSYADFVTLLFAFFVVLFASSSVDHRKVRSFAAGFVSLMDPRAKNLPGSLPAESAAPWENSDADTKWKVYEALTASEMGPTRDLVEAELMPEITAGKIELSVQPRGIVLSLSESTFFATGQAALRPGAEPILVKLAAALKKTPGHIQLEGHTDDRPIMTPRFPSNWQLSAARAIAVLRALSQRHGIAPERLTAAGYAEFRPLVPNTTESNQARNRRVDVVILNPDAVAGSTSKLTAAQVP